MLKALAILATFCSPAMADICALNMNNAEVLASIEKHNGETLRFVGISGLTGLPIEVTVSEDGGWTMLMVDGDKVCFLGIGKNWQAVEPKPPGVEN